MTRNNDIAESVNRVLDRYFKIWMARNGCNLQSGNDAEKPMLEFVLRQANGKQTIAAGMLGINATPNARRKPSDQSAVVRCHPRLFLLMKAAPRIQRLRQTRRPPFARHFATNSASSCCQRHRAKSLRRGLTGLPVTDVSGTCRLSRDARLARVKTLHPRVPGSVLARRDLPEHLRDHLPITTSRASIWWSMTSTAFQPTVVAAGLQPRDAIQVHRHRRSAMVRRDRTTVRGRRGRSRHRPDDYRRSSPELQVTTDASLQTHFSLAAGLHARRRYDSAISNHPAALSEMAENSPTGPGCSSPSTRSRTCATAKTLTRRRVLPQNGRHCGFGPIPNCRARTVL